MHEEILDWIHKIESCFNIKIVYAIEAGSRAWGLSHQKSDYDVRFIYVDRVEYYLGLISSRSNDHRLHIRDIRKHPTFADLPIDIDFDGWEFRRAMGKTVASSGTLVEWLNSPVVYVNKLNRHNVDFKTRAKILLRDFIDSRTLLDHYQGLVFQATSEIQQDSENRLTKKIFYGLRCMFAYEWVLKHSNARTTLADLPNDFMLLVESNKLYSFIAPNEWEAIYALIGIKKVTNFGKIDDPNVVTVLGLLIRWLSFVENDIRYKHMKKVHHNTTMASTYVADWLKTILFNKDIQ